MAKASNSKYTVGNLEIFIRTLPNINLLLNKFNDANIDKQLLNYKFMCESFSPYMKRYATFFNKEENNINFLKNVLKEEDLKHIGLFEENKNSFENFVKTTGQGFKEFKSELLKLLQEGEEIINPMRLSKTSGEVENYLFKIPSLEINYENYLDNILENPIYQHVLKLKEVETFLKGDVAKANNYKNFKLAQSLFDKYSSHCQDLFDFSKLDEPATEYQYLSYDDLTKILGFTASHEQELSQTKFTDDYLAHEHKLDLLAWTPKGDSSDEE